LYKYPKLTELSKNEYPKCKKCGRPMRPHVLLFDEFYREDLYKANTAIQLGENCDCMLIIGSELLTTFWKKQR